MSVPRAVAVIAVLVAALAVPAPAVAQREPVQGELLANAELSAVRGDPLALRVFLKRMPKGADLHSHLHSAVYAETLIRNAVDDKLCVDEAAFSFAKPQSIRDDAPLHRRRGSRSDGLQGSAAVWPTRGCWSKST
jgi:hypothetical protein